MIVSYKKHDLINEIDSLGYSKKQSFPKINQVFIAIACLSIFPVRAGLKFHQLAASDKYYSALR